VDSLFLDDLRKILLQKGEKKGCEKVGNIHSGLCLQFIATQPAKKLLPTSKIIMGGGWYAFRSNSRSKSINSPNLKNPVRLGFGCCLWSSIASLERNVVVTSVRRTRLALRVEFVENNKKTSKTGATRQSAPHTKRLLSLSLSLVWTDRQHTSH
jgi:hypothetical protein